MACLTESDLLQFFEGDVGPEEEQRVSNHLDDCGDCRRLAELLSDDEEARRFRHVVQQTRSGDYHQSSPADDETPSQNHERELGRFRIIDTLGVGGFGVVYLAFDTTLKRKVAVKLPKQAAFSDRDAKERFMREAEIAANLHHPNIVPVFEAGEAEGLCYLASAYCSGPSLAAWHHEHRERVDSRVAARIVERLARAVAHAHESGVLHRDIKPANVLLELEKPSGELPFTPMLTDFGLAKLVDDKGAATVSGAVFGTPRYMAPEQAAGRRDQVGLRTDVYALGAVLYELLTDRPPIEGEDNADTLRRVLESEPQSPRRIHPDVSVDVEAICLKCLEKDPARRYENAARLGKDLNRYLDGEPILARRVGSLERSWRWCRRRPATAASILAGTASILTVFVLVLVAMQLDASRERAKRLEKDAELRETQLVAARELADSQRKVAATQHYHALLSGVRERAGDSESGWAYQGLRDLQTAASLDVDSINERELRNEAARCIMGIDLREIASIRVPSGYEPHLIAFHPDERQLAVATLGNETELYVLVCDVPSGEILDDVRVPVTELEFDGIRHLAYLGTGDEIAFTTRSGWLHRWQPNAAPHSLRSTRMPCPVGQPFVFDGPRSRAFFRSDKQIYVWPDLTLSTADEFYATTPHRLHVSPDGRWLAASKPHGVEIIDTRTAQYVQHIDALPEKINFGPDGRFLAGATVAELVLADVESGRTARTITDPNTGQLHSNTVTEATFSPSGGLLMTSGFDQKFKLWDAHSGDLLVSVFIAGADEVRAAFSPDESYVAATGSDRVVLYSLNGLDVLGTVARQAEPILAFDVSRDPPVLFCSAQQQGREYVDLSLWDFEEGRRIDHWQSAGSFRGSAPVAVSDDGQVLAAGTGNWSSIDTWQVDREKILKRPIPPANATRCSAEWGPVPRLFFHGGTFVSSGAAAAVSDPLPISSLGLPWSHVDAALNWGNGKAYFFAGDEFCEFDIGLNRVLSGFPKKIADHWPGLWKEDIDAAVNYRGGTAFFLHGDEFMEFRVASRSLKHHKPIAKRWANGVYASNVDAVLAVNDDTGAINFYQGDSYRKYVGYQYPVTEHVIHKELPDFPPNTSVQAAVDLGLRNQLHYRLGTSMGEIRAGNVSVCKLSRAGDMLFGIVGDRHLEVAAWSLQDSTERWRWSNAQAAEDVGIGMLSSLDVSESWIVVGAKSKSMILLNIESGEAVFNIQAPGRVSSVTLADDESLLAGGTFDGTVIIATVTEGKIIARLEEHRDEITSLAFSDGGRLLATASLDKTIRLWQRDGDGFEQVLTLKPGGPVQQLRFTGGGEQLIASIKGESVLRVWQVKRLRERLADVELNW